MTIKTNTEPFRIKRRMQTWIRRGGPPTDGNERNKKFRETNPFKIGVTTWSKNDYENCPESVRTHFMYIRRSRGEKHGHHGDGRKQAFACMCKTIPFSDTLFWRKIMK